MLAAPHLTTGPEVLGIESEVILEEKGKKIRCAPSQIMQGCTLYLCPRMQPQCVLCTGVVFLRSDN